METYSNHSKQAIQKISSHLNMPCITSSQVHNSKDKANFSKDILTVMPSLFMSNLLTKMKRLGTKHPALHFCHSIH